ncbi:hypothetical protein B0I33_10272 [Prauserella shujinwangii]|uniref:Transcriptional regulator, AbiEi antitoxin, Type IV TA system n=1 Tax=Prauserella shujinwangii TaxID=1453103 RepID=A0A2T0M056_9PSEU|nr:hypothetical protein [Prauserella shujinwangii]PRX49957.1 hypothetical protein B0I33_10272 [Prauserella shujinwangii]
MPLHRRWSTEAVPPDRRTSWQCLLDDQAGVVSLAQLYTHGHSEADVVANLKAGRWRRVLPRVLATFTGELPRPARLHAALLYGGGLAALSHHTAAEEWGMLPIADRPVEITVPYTCSAVSQPPVVRVHRSRALRHSVVETAPRRTKRTDTIVDLAVAQDSAQQATYLVVDLVSSAAVPVADMRGCVQNRPPRRYRAAITHALDLVAGGFMSALEVEYSERVERAHGIPPGRRQTPVEVDGKVLWEDVTYDPLGVPLTVRLDGRRHHATARVAFRDRRRDNAAELAARSRLVYGWHDVHTAPCAVAAEVRAVLHRHGWEPTESRCRCSGLVSEKRG